MGHVRMDKFINSVCTAPCMLHLDWGFASPSFYRVLKSRLTEGFSKVYASPCIPCLQVPKIIDSNSIEKHISQQTRAHGKHLRQFFGGKDIKKSRHPSINKFISATIFGLHPTTESSAKHTQNYHSLPNSGTNKCQTLEIKPSGDPDLPKL